MNIELIEMATNGSKSMSESSQSMPMEELLSLCPLEMVYSLEVSIMCVKKAKNKNHSEKDAYKKLHELVQPQFNWERQSDGTNIRTISYDEKLIAKRAVLAERVKVSREDWQNSTIILKDVTEEIISRIFYDPERDYTITSFQGLKSEYHLNNQGMIKLVEVAGEKIKKYHVVVFGRARNYSQMRYQCIKATKKAKFLKIKGLPKFSVRIASLDDYLEFANDIKLLSQ